MSQVDDRSHDHFVLTTARGRLSSEEPEVEVHPLATGRGDVGSRVGPRVNDAIRMLGRIAGNSYEHPIWPEVKPYVARGGQYYDFFLRLAPPGLSRSEQEAEAFANVRLYQEWFEKGRAQPFNESDNINKIRRIQQIATEVIAVYK